MQVLYERCAGLDVHQGSITVCALVPGPRAQPERQQRKVGTMTADILALGDWLADLGVTHVAMESTGVYWKPVWNLLEERCTLLLVNPQHIKALPGRKSDDNDSAWIAQLLRHGLLRASFVPDRAQRELRELTRYREQLVGECTAEINRLAKTLEVEGANIKLSSVVSQLTGVSARAMLDALVAGEDDPAILAALAHGRMRDKRAALEQALTGRMTAHGRFLVAQHLTHIDFLDEQIAAVSAEIAARLHPFADELALLDSIPGIGRRTAEVVLSMIGTDMTRFPSAKHLASWGGLCPGQHESAGKRMSSRTRKGNRSLQVILVEAAHAAGHSQRTVVGERHRRLVARKGTKRAAIATAHLLLRLIYQVLTTGQPYHDALLQPHALPAQQREQRRMVRRLEGMGYTVTLAPSVVA